MRGERTPAISQSENLSSIVYLILDGRGQCQARFGPCAGDAGPPHRRTPGRGQVMTGQDSVGTSAGTAGGTSGPLGGLRVVDLSTPLPGAQATQFLADAGADVVLVEQPGGSPLRSLPGWPVHGRGKRSVLL